MDRSQSISPEAILAFRQKFEENALSHVASRAASKTSLEDVCYDGEAVRSLNHRFSLDIPTLEACDQKSSGRCWIFAGLSLLREKIAKELDLESFELSQSYLSFYDHLEKANTFYEHILSTADRPLEDRYVSQLLTLPLMDGGWWEYFVGLVKKYGVVPKDAMPETYQSSHSDTMNMLINMQLRKDALTLRRACAAGEGAEELDHLKQELLARIYHVLAVCLGTPPETFDFEYVDRKKQYHVHRELTAKAFYDTYLGRNLDNMVSLMNAPTDAVPFYKTCYTEGEESIYGSYQAKRLNLPLEQFKSAVLRQLQAGEPVWFVCDCDYFGNQTSGIWDTQLYGYEALLGLDFQLEKGELLDLRQCSLNHAMLLTGVNLVEGKPDKWKIQNSWGTEKADKGYFIMSDRWFDRYVFTASIDRKYMTEEENRLFDQEPMILPPWNVLA